MTYIKAILSGIVGAFIAALLWILVAFVLPIAIPFLLSRMNPSHGAGIGAASASIGDGSIILAAVVGFVVGAYWMLKA